MVSTPPVIRLIQMASEPGDLAGNRRVIQAACRGLKSGELAVFPELALSGYMLRSGRRQAALAAKRAPLAALSPRRGAALLGFVEQGEDHHLYNSAALLQSGSPARFHRKTFLPTYSMFEEGRFFARGADLHLLHWNGLKLGVMICEEGWHLPIPHALAAAGADVLVWLAAGPEKGNHSAPAWQRLATVYAELLGVYVVLVNRVGVERGVSFCGGSCAVAPGGKMMLSLPAYQAAIGQVEISASRLARIRRRAPMLADERRINPQVIEVES
jgi:predicted amidohydrolase